MKKRNDYFWDAVANVITVLFVLAFLYYLPFCILFPNNVYEVHDFLSHEFALYMRIGGVFYLMGWIRLFFKKKIAVFTILLPAVQFILWMHRCFGNWGWRYYSDVYQEVLATEQNLLYLRTVILFNIICSALLCIAFLWHRFSQNVRQKRKELRTESA